MRVIPAVATFSVDNGFWYSVPRALSEVVEIGSIVRVPLSGRRVRGYVVEVSGLERAGLKDVIAVSGSRPVFSRESLRGLEWAASHYFAPLAAVLDRAAPPNLPKDDPPSTFPEVPQASGSDGLGAVAQDVAASRKRRPVAVVGRRGEGRWLDSLTPVLASGNSVLVVVATAAEAEGLSRAARRTFGERIVTVAGGTDAEVTKAWTVARQPGVLLVGTPRVAAWTLPSLGMCVVVDEGRRAMKDRQTPTIHVRELLLQRARVEGFSLVFFGPTPSLELLAAGVEIVREPGRSWSLVEIVDRSSELPGSGFLSDRVMAGIGGALKNGWQTFVFTHRRVGSQSMRCAHCRAVRACPRCGSGLTAEACRRCGARTSRCLTCGREEFEAMGTIPERLRSELVRKLGPSAVAVAPSSTAPVVVGTERNLAEAGLHDLAVVADADGILLGHNYRSGEEALRVIARLGNLIAPGSGRRLMVQTSLPDSPLASALRSGDPIPYLEQLLAERVRDRLPPVTSMLAIEARGEVDAMGMTAELQFPGVAVMGPATTTTGARWLLQGDLSRSRTEMRRLVGRWRDTGLTVRVDADPIDL